jgi:hypothetical protein
MPCLFSPHHHHLASAGQQPWEGALPRLCAECPEEAPYHLRAQVIHRREPQVLPRCEKRILQAQGTAERQPQSPRLLLHWLRPHQQPLVDRRERRAARQGNLSHSLV